MAEVTVEACQVVDYKGETTKWAAYGDYSEEATTETTSIEVKGKKICEEASAETEAAAAKLASDKLAQTLAGYGRAHAIDKFTYTPATPVTTRKVRTWGEFVADFGNYWMRTVRPNMPK